MSCEQQMIEYLEAEIEASAVRESFLRQLYDRVISAVDILDENELVVRSI